MGSGVLLAALVVLWFVVLVPMVVTRGEARTAGAGVADSGRTLRRRRAVDPVVHAETERVSVDRDELRHTGELKVDVRAIRRRTLLGLVTLAALTVAGAVVIGGLWLWLVQAALDAAVVGYVCVLRRAARRERLAARRAARAAEREALRAAAQRPVYRRVSPAQRPAAAVDERLRETVAQEALPDLPNPSVPLAPVHPLRPGRVVAARVATPSGWQHSAVVGLDDDDIGFADIDVYTPRAANA
jgi:hypothetical protein